MTDHDPTSQECIAQLSHSLERTLDQGRALFGEMARFTQDESLRFAHMQLEHADHAFSHFRERRDLSGLVSAQQEWVKQMMQEYAAMSLRYAEMFRALAQPVHSHVESAASAFQHRAEEMAEDLGRAYDGMPRAHNGVHAEHPHLPAEWPPKGGIGLQSAIHPSARVEGFGSVCAGRGHLFFRAARPAKAPTRSLVRPSSRACPAAYKALTPFS